MLYYKAGRFYCGKVSFAMPDDIYLLITEADVVAEFGLVLEEPQKHYSFDVAFECAEQGARAELERMSEESVRAPEGITEYTTKGTHPITGWYLAYKNKTEQTFAFYADVETGIESAFGESVNCIDVGITIPVGEPVDEDIVRKTFWALVDSICVE